jgi:hypothetical protein
LGYTLGDFFTSASGHSASSRAMSHQLDKSWQFDKVSSVVSLLPFVICWYDFWRKNELTCYARNFHSEIELLRHTVIQQNRVWQIFLCTIYQNGENIYRNDYIIYQVTIKYIKWL